MKNLKLSLLMGLALLTPKAEATASNLDGLLIASNALMLAHGCYKLKFTNEEDYHTPALQAAVALGTIKGLVNKDLVNEFYTRDLFINSFAVINFAFFSYFSYKTWTDKKNTSEAISREKIKSIIMAAFYLLNTYQLKK